MLIQNDRRMQRILSGLALVVAILVPVLAVASGGGEHHPESGAQLKDFGWRVVDFALLVGIVVWALKKANVKGSLADRQQQIEKNLSEARAAREAAEAKLKEYTEKLDKANQEVDALRAAMLKEAETEKQRIIAEAQAAAAKVVVQAAQAADQEVLKARTELRVEAARLAVELAGGKLGAAVQKADHDRFVQDYLGKVVQL
ncbi:MAG: ATP synthase F0 subunit B [Geobacter sp.]|nr:ATP synthase F0 subunit B [Geobacter sp.]